MDKLERQLKDDAKAIRAEIPPELAARLGASIQAAAPGPRPARSSRSAFAWWWLSSLSGVAAAFLLIVVLNRDDAPTADRVDEVPVATESPTRTVPPLVEVPLDVRTADFAEPLADELNNLKSDIEKAREKLGEDLRFTL
jgi:hypothetical protein